MVEKSSISDRLKWLCVLISLLCSALMSTVAHAQEPLLRHRTPLTEEQLYAEKQKLRQAREDLKRADLNSESRQTAERLLDKRQKLVEALIIRQHIRQAQHSLYQK